MVTDVSDLTLHIASKHFGRLLAGQLQPNLLHSIAHDMAQMAQQSLVHAHSVT